jgi:uncharacterized membrane protein
MRTAGDRIRHTISFELIGLALVVPLGSWVFGMPMIDIGVVGVAGATIATVWNYVYNLVFDIAMQRVTGGTQKSIPARALHAVLFEAGLMAILTPLMAWYLGIGLLLALTMDVAFAAFYMVYTFIFNWAYDLAFPLPAWQESTQTSHAAP